MVKVVKSDELESSGADQIKQTLTSEIGALLKEVNRQMSNWLKDSEISRFNQYKESDWFGVSGDTVLVIAEGLRISEKSGGAFDITVGPLIDLWGFGPVKKEKQIPGEEQIKAVKAKIGYQKLEVRQSPPSVKKEAPDIHCDLSAIAKGFGVDKVAGYLDSKGFSDYLVEIGGEVRAKGMNHRGVLWRVAVATPDGTSNYQKVLSLKDISMATSGDYHNYFEKDGVRYSHTIDPTTGRPITHKLASVTVIHESCMTADALATAINVLGPGKGYELAIKENLPVFLVVKEGGVFAEKMTPRFEKILGR
jgi:thiamine biosynthesis lipoprotein